MVEDYGQPVQPVRIEPEQVQKQGERSCLAADPAIRVDSRAYKMSKSRGNVVNPDQVVQEYGADALRLYEMFMGPLEAVKPWSMEGVSGVRGFLDRAWRMIVDDRAETVRLAAAVRDVEPTAEQNRMLHKTIQAVTPRHRADVVQHGHRADDGIHQFLPQGRVPAAVGDGAVRAAAGALRAAPGRRALAGVGPRRDAGLSSPGRSSTRPVSREDTVEVPVQINGKLRGRIRVAAEQRPPTALEAAARGRRAHCRVAGRQDDREGDRRAGADGEFRGEVGRGKK